MVICKNVVKKISKNHIHDTEFPESRVQYDLK